jgi:predicted nucleotidyltransferase
VTLPTPYPDLNEVLHDLVGGVQAVLCDAFVGAYLQGSFAVGGFDRHSDVDFVIAVEDELSDDRVLALQAVHERIYGLDCGWAQHLEGSYFPREILRDYARSGEPLWYLEHGKRSLVRSNHCNTVVVRWTVREHGVALAGPSALEVVDPIPVEVLRQDILTTIRDWGQEILAEPDRFRNRFYQSFIVLSYCRMLYDLLIGDTASKRVGAEWAKATLDPAWAGLIDRAWDGRPDPAVSSRQPADPADFSSTLEFLVYATDYASGLVTP